MSNAILHEIERQSRIRTQRVRLMLLEEERLDILADFDRNMKDIQTGVSSARGIWHALSEAQRRVMRDLSEGRQSGKHRTHVPLMKRNLIAWDSANMTLTEHGRFVLKFGPT
jgi:hypothetical protein